MDWWLVLNILYVIAVALVCLRIIVDTRSSTKTAAYLLLIVFLPLIGMFIYFTFGINYRKNKIYSKKLYADSNLAKQLKQNIIQVSKDTFEGKKNK